MRSPGLGILLPLDELERVSIGVIRMWDGISPAASESDIEILPGEHYETRSFGYTVELVSGDEVHARRDDGERMVLSLEAQRRIQTNTRRDDALKAQRTRPSLGDGWLGEQPARLIATV